MDDSEKRDDVPSHSLSYEETPIIDPSSGHVTPEPSLDAEHIDDDPSSVVPEAAQVFGSQPSVEIPRQVQENPPAPPKK